MELRGGEGGPDSPGRPSSFLSQQLPAGLCLCPFSLTWFVGRSQGEEAEGDAGHGAAAGSEHEPPALVALWSGSPAVQTRHLQRLPPPGDPEEAGRAAGEREPPRLLLPASSPTSWFP